MKLEIKINNLDAVNAKFLNTIKTLNGYLQEAKGDNETGQIYSGRAVYERLESIINAFNKDMKALANDIIINETIDSSLDTSN